MSTTVAFVGVTGGAGTTRVSVEVGATLARAGHSVAVLDAAFATQGLATHVEGRIDPDLTRVLADEAAFGDALVDVWPVLDGRAAIAPVHAPPARRRLTPPDSSRPASTTPPASSTTSSSTSRRWPTTSRSPPSLAWTGAP